MAKKVTPINPVKREWLKELRNEKNLSVRAIAPLIGTSYQNYSDIENGRRNPSIKLSQSICKFFNCDMDLFFVDRVQFNAEEPETEVNQ